MGWGDDLMWLGEASKVHENNPDAVIIPDQSHSVIWDNVPWVAGKDYSGLKKKIELKTKPNGNRWYIEGWAPGKIIYKEYKPIPAPYTFTSEELDNAKKILNKYGLNGDFIIVNPDTKNTTLANNKDWGFPRWEKLTSLIAEDIPVVRLRPARSIEDVSGQVKYSNPNLFDAVNISADNIRQAFALASFSTAIVTSEGGMHHFAAAINKPAFIIYGGVISPKNTGYKDRNQTYYIYEKNSPCGSQVNCVHCKIALASITPKQIYQDISTFLKLKQEALHLIKL